MELYYVNDQPRLIYDTFKYARVRTNCEKHIINDKEYYICDARNYDEAIEQLLLRSRQYSNGTLADGFKAAIIHATGLLVDPLRGDGFTLLMISFDEWHVLLEDYITPKEYL